MRPNFRLGISVTSVVVLITMTIAKTTAAKNNGKVKEGSRIYEPTFKSLTSTNYTKGKQRESRSEKIVIIPKEARFGLPKLYVTAGLATKTKLGGGGWGGGGTSGGGGGWGGVGGGGSGWGGGGGGQGGWGGGGSGGQGGWGGGGSGGQGGGWGGGGGAGLGWGGGGNSGGHGGWGSGGGGWGGSGGGTGGWGWGGSGGGGQAGGWGGGGGGWGQPSGWGGGGGGGGGGWCPTKKELKAKAKAQKKKAKAKAKAQKKGGGGWGGGGGGGWDDEEDSGEDGRSVARSGWSESNSKGHSEDLIDEEEVWPNSPPRTSRLEVSENGIANDGQPFDRFPYLLNLDSGYEVEHAETKTDFNNRKSEESGEELPKFPISSDIVPLPMEVEANPIFPEKISLRLVCPKLWYSKGPKSPSMCMYIRA